MAKPHVLVTGCMGGVGHALSCKLLDNGWRISGLDLASATSRTLPENIPIHRLDLGDTSAVSALQSLINMHDGVIHLAGVSRVGQGKKDPLGAVRANILGTANLLEAIRRAEQPPWLLFASSLEVKVTAQGAFSLTNMYGLTKSVSELLAHRYASDYKLKIAAARLTGVYGHATDYPDKVPVAFVHAAVAGTSIRAVRNSRPGDYVHIDAACAMLMDAAERLSKTAAGTYAVFEIRSGRRITLAGFARLIRRIAGSKSPITLFDVPKIDDLPVSRWNIPHTGPDLESGISSLIRAVREHIAPNA